MGLIIVSAEPCRVEKAGGHRRGPAMPAPGHGHRLEKSSADCFINNGRAYAWNWKTRYFEVVGGTTRAGFKSC